MISFLTMSPDDTTSPSKVHRKFVSPPRQSYACLTIDWIRGTEVIGACGSMLVWKTRWVTAMASCVLNSGKELEEL